MTRGCPTHEIMLSWPVVSNKVQSGWADDSADSDHGEAPTAQAAQCADGEKDWTAENEQAKSDTFNFGKSAPGPRLLLTTVAVRPIIGLIRHYERVSSKAFDVESLYNAGKGESSPSRIAMAREGSLTREFVSEASALLTKEPWDNLLGQADTTHKNNNIVFSLVSCALCGVMQLLSHRYALYPFKLWDLLNSDLDLATVIESILKDPKCMQDKFTKVFLKFFRGRLNSDICLLTLFSIGLLARLDIARLECKHASIRRFLAGFGVSWVKHIEHVSCDFAVSQARIAEHLAGRTLESTSGVKEGDGDGEQSGNGGISHGGGGQRAFMSEYLRKHLKGNTKRRNAIFMRGNTEYKRLQREGGDAYRKVIVKGKAGTASRRSGGKSFGEVPCNLRRTGVSQRALDALRHLRGTHVESKVCFH
jgi:hypothetical protein